MVNTPLTFVPKSLEVWNEILSFMIYFSKTITVTCLLLTFAGQESMILLFIITRNSENTCYSCFTTVSRSKHCTSPL